MQLKTVHTAPWPHCPNKNVFSNRLKWPYDSPHSLRLGGRLFQTCGPAAAKVLSTNVVLVRLITSVRVSAERSCLITDTLSHSSQTHYICLALCICICLLYAAKRLGRSGRNNRTHLDPGSVLVSQAQCRQHENGGAIGTEMGTPRANTLGHRHENGGVIGANSVHPGDEHYG